MKTFVLILVIGISFLPIATRVWLERDACPFACRIDANGIKGAWYESELPFLGQRTLWVSPEQKEIIRTLRATGELK